MSADFSRVATHLADGVIEHADRDRLTGVLRAVFIDRGGHAPGEACPTATQRDAYWDPHWDECSFCAAYDA